MTSPAPTAFDQKYIHGRDIFENISTLVDEMLQSYIRRVDSIEPLAASFCNGTTVTCPGMSQWGSQDLARNGYSYIDILRAYYGDDIEVVSNVPVRGLTPSYPGTPLRLGSAGEAVLQLQGGLNRIAKNYPAIPKIDPLDGLFGPSTEEAVIAFQKIFNLTPDGIVGPATWYQIISIYVAVTKLAELQSEGQKYMLGSYDLPNVLSLGSSGEAVSQLQYMLNVLSDAYSGSTPGYHRRTIRHRHPGRSVGVSALCGSYPQRSSGSLHLEQYRQSILWHHRYGAGQQHPVP